MTSQVWSGSSIDTFEDALLAIDVAWKLIISECRQVLGGELHYQAMVYHCLRETGVPLTQIGMNVKQWIIDPVSPLFREADLRKHENFRGGFEPIPDVVIFSREVNADWRRRNYDRTLMTMLAAIEIKASERQGIRLRSKEILADIEKLAAHRDEVAARGRAMAPVMMVIDTAPIDEERMQSAVIAACKGRASELEVFWYYLSPELVDSPKPSE
jgi:hypothetical protein